ncbi:MAG: class I SAM-dependent methyltransferase [Methylococcaceae bacterium]
MNNSNAKQCPLCGSEHHVNQEILSPIEINKLYSKSLGVEDAIKTEYLSYLSCQNCGLGFFDPMETGGEDLYERLQAFDWYYMADKYEYAIAMKYLPAEGTVLEVGAGKAAFAEKVGVDRYTGLEFNDKAIERAGKSGIRLIKQPVDAHAVDGYTYDAVVSFQVLEHVSDPAGFIRGCVQCLKPDGRLIFGVPAHDGFAGSSVNNILDMPPHHVTHWTGETLRKLAPLFGLELLALDYEPVAKYHRPWAFNIVWEVRLRRFLGWPPCLLDRSLRAKLVSKIAAFLAKIAPISVDALNGHTVIATYKRS